MASNKLIYQLSKQTVKQRFKCKPSIPNQEGLTNAWLLTGTKPENTKFGLYPTPIGIEVELENINVSKLYPSVFWTFTQDGSLRNGGIEFVSVPVGGNNIDYALLDLKNLLAKQDFLVSIRCSTHVHINVSDLDISVLKFLITTYACLENLFFSYVDPDRFNNPFCFPLTRSTASSYRDIENILGSMKYCAFNLDHLRDYGTVEFRHMEGMSSIDKLERHIQLIQKLLQFVKTTNLQNLYNQIMMLNTSSDYHLFVTQIFSPIEGLFKNLNLQKEMEDGVTWAKLFLTQDDKECAEFLDF